MCYILTGEIALCLEVQSHDSSCSLGHTTLLNSTDTNMYKYVLLCVQWPRGMLVNYMLQDAPSDCEWKQAQQAHGMC